MRTPKASMHGPPYIGRLPTPDAIKPMNSQQLTQEALEILMTEYGGMRQEILERLKVAFSHVAYAGAIAAFSIPAADKISDWIPRGITFVFAAIAFLFLSWVALLNMRWVQHCGAYLQRIEAKINARFGTEVLGWETYAGTVMADRWWKLPADPRRRQ